MAAPLWQPSAERIAQTNITGFIKSVNADWHVKLADSKDLYRFSISSPEKFWASLKDFADIIAETWGDQVLVGGDKMPGAKWFPDARLNFAENLLRRRDETEAIVFWGEDKVRRRLTHADLYNQVSVLAQALQGLGVKPGDRVVGYIPNMPEAVAAMLATVSIGAVWSSCSPDFGVQGVLDRFGQIEPKAMFTVEGYYYNGKAHNCLDKLADIAGQLSAATKTVVIPYTKQDFSVDGIRGAITLDQFISGYEPTDITFKRMPFNHPLYIMFSSGTTGVPKCIVHGAGGTLLQHMKEHLLHCDAKPGDRVFYYTTCGWMMWNWLVSALASQATLLLFDGSPFYPDGNVLFDLADAEDMTLLGVSAKYIDVLKKENLEPVKSHLLKHLRMIASTGSPLVPESFDYVYDKIKSDVHLASISGGADIISCFVLGDPTSSVWRGEIQTRGLGMAVDVFTDEGAPVREEKGELVCLKPFPSMPIGFWDDPDDVKFHAAYFDKFPGVWTHGDYVEITAHDGLIIHGRSDATLNPGGVRIGTAEIYRQVENIDQVVEGIVIGQDWQGDVRVLLFVKLRQGLTLDDALIDKIKKRIRTNCSPRHVPAKVIQVADIPRTKSGKITELAVRDVIHGRPVKNKEALANPEALELYKNLVF